MAWVGLLHRAIWMLWQDVLSKGLATLAQTTQHEVERAWPRPVPLYIYCTWRVEPFSLRMQLKPAETVYTATHNSQYFPLSPYTSFAWLEYTPGRATCMSVEIVHVVHRRLTSLFLYIAV